MINWMVCTVKYTKQTDSGFFKRVSEKHLFAAMTFTHAEARVYEELGDMIRGEFLVSAIAKEELHDIFGYDDAEIWWKCKVSYASSTDDSERVKKINQTFLVSANTVKEATDRLNENLSTMMVDYEIVAVTKSPIVDIYPYKEELDVEISRKPILEGVEDAND